MIFSSDFKALKTIKKDWEIDGKTGVSRKTQILAENFGEFSALTVKTAKDVPELVSGEDYRGVFEISEAYTEGKSKQVVYQIQLLKVE